MPSGWLLETLTGRTHRANRQPLWVVIKWGPKATNALIVVLLVLVLVLVVLDCLVWLVKKSSSRRCAMEVASVSLSLMWVLLAIVIVVEVAEVAVVAVAKTAVFVGCGDDDGDDGP